MTHRIVIVKQFPLDYLLTNGLEMLKPNDTRCTYLPIPMSKWYIFILIPNPVSPMNSDKSQRDSEVQISDVVSLVVSYLQLSAIELDTDMAELDVSHEREEKRGVKKNLHSLKDLEKEEKEVISTLTATIGIGAVLTMLGIPKL